MKQKKLVVVLSIIFAAILTVSGALLIINRPETKAGEKKISVTVISSDKSEKKLDITTDAEFLADALFEEKIIMESEYKSGFYTLIAGERADYALDGAWWCVTKSGEMTSTGMNELVIEDGDDFEITYTPA